MSTIYSDALGNKFLGNCKWGNHDINYPSTNYLVSEPATQFSLAFRQDMVALMQSCGYTSTGHIATWDSNNISINSNIVYGTPPGLSAFIWKSSNYGNWSNHAAYGSIIETRTGLYVAPHVYDFYYTSFCSSVSLGLQTWAFNSNPSTFRNSTRQSFCLWAKLQDVNPNFGYYTGADNHVICLSTAYSVSSTTTLTSSLVESQQLQRHYIVGAQKDLLVSGEAVYFIACSNGATPTGQWATDMYVFDNNATLGYPCIGRVPNMLLGVGTFTYLKPVELITAPDAGSNLWLPVGRFAGRTLLMRCYSE